jgi:hypothetical protein
MDSDTDVAMFGGGTWSEWYLPSISCNCGLGLEGLVHNTT